MGDSYQTMIQNLEEDFKDVKSIQELVSQCDSTQRISNNNYERNDNQYDLNVNKELQDRRDSNEYLRHKYIMGVNSLPTNELDSDNYVVDVVERATSDKCHNVLEFCQKMNDDLEEIDKRDKEVYGQSIHSKNEQIFTELDYNVSFLDMFERDQIPKGNFISKKVKNDPFYKKLQKDIKMKNKVDPIFTTNVVYSPFKQFSGYRL